MKAKNIKFMAIFLVLLLCLVGAVNAADNTTTDHITTTTDTNDNDVVTTDNNVHEEISKAITTEPPKETVKDTKKRTQTTISNTKTLKANKDEDILKDGKNVIYVNESKEDSGDGSSWEEAYGENGFFTAMDDIAEGGTIYLSPKTYSGAINNDKNFTIIGIDRENTIITSSIIGCYDQYGSSNLIIFNNLIFKKNKRNKPLSIEGNAIFINCTFENIIRTAEDIYNLDKDTHGQNTHDVTESFDIKFIDCEFKDQNIEGSLIEAFKFSKITFNNCTFENITANSIVRNAIDADNMNSGFTLQDAITFNNCNFNNLTVKGIVDVPTDTSIGLEDGSRVQIEDCLYNGASATSFGVLTEGTRDYVNATAPRIQPKISAEIKDETLLINLTDDEGNPIDADVSISVNGVSKGEYSIDGPINISDLIEDNTGLITIDITFNTLNDFIQYKTASKSVIYDARNATSIIANDLSTEVSVAKNLTVTLKDNNGKPLADKEILVSINGVASTPITTNANGEANITINYPETNTYTYTLTYNGDETYKNSTKNVTVTITPVTAKTYIKSEIINNEAGEVAIFINVLDKNTDETISGVIVNITGDVTVTNFKTDKVLHLEELTAGKYTLKITYIEPSNLETNETVTLFVVNTTATYDTIINNFNSEITELNNTLNTTETKLNTTQKELDTANKNLANKISEATNLQAQVNTLTQENTKLTNDLKTETEKTTAATNNADVKIKTVSAKSKIQKSKKYTIIVTLNKKVKGKYVYIIFNGKTYKKQTKANGKVTIAIKASIIKKLAGKRIKYQIISGNSMKNKSVKIKK